MAFDEKLADRVRSVLPASSHISEKKMFGGVAFLVDGKMFAGVAGTDLMVRPWVRQALAYVEALPAKKKKKPKAKKPTKRR